METLWEMVKVFGALAALTTLLIALFEVYI